MSFVLDHSVTMRWCFGDGMRADLQYADHVLDAMRASYALVPAIWSQEVANVLARAESRKLIAEAHTEGFLSRLRRLPIQTDPDSASQSFTATLQIARRYRLSSYDAAYLELALRQELPLATLDADLREAARQAGTPLMQVP